MSCQQNSEMKPFVVDDSDEEEEGNNEEEDGDTEEEDSEDHDPDDIHEKCGQAYEICECSFCLKCEGDDGETCYCYCNPAHRDDCECWYSQIYYT
jgi:hypothetical protein